MVEIDSFAKAVIASNLEIIELLKSGSSNFFSKSVSKGAGGDISIKIDILAEKIFIKNLSSFGNIYSEECGFVDNNKNSTIIIDPIDGSSNFVSNIPYYGTSVALKEDGKYIFGAIVNLVSGDIFLKEKRGFSKASIYDLNFEKVLRNKESKFGLFERSYTCNEIVNKMQENSIKYRSLGAIALSLAYGHYVDFILFLGKVREYDVAAGLYMCEDLYVAKKDNLLLVSKDKEIFDKIVKFI